MLPISDKRKGITDILIVCQLYSSVMGEWHVLNKLMFVIYAIDQVVIKMASFFTLTDSVTSNDY